MTRVYRGLIQPKRVLGITYSFFIALLFGAPLVFLASGRLSGLLVVLPGWCLARWMTVRDWQRPWVWFAWLRYCARGRNQWYWGGNCYPVGAQSGQGRGATS